MYCVLLAHISIFPAAELAIPIDTPTTGGVVSFVMDLVHEIALHVLPLIVNVDIFNVNEGDTCPFT